LVGDGEKGVVGRSVVWEMGELGMMRLVVEKMLKYGLDKLESDKEMGNVVVRVD